MILGTQHSGQFVWLRSLASFEKQICYVEVPLNSIHQGMCDEGTLSSLMTGPLLSTDGQRQSNSASTSRPSLYLASPSTRSVLTTLLSMLSIEYLPLCRVQPLSVSVPSGPLPLTCGKFDSMLQSLAAAMNLDPSQLSGHSFRSGGATLAFQVQIPAELIKRLGDWQSAYRSYIHIPVEDRMLAVRQLASFV